MLSQNDIDLFDKYINEELDPGSRLALEERLFSDESFNTQFLNYKDTVNTVNTLFVGQEMGTIIDRKQKQSIRSINQYWYLAASVTIILFGLIWVWVNNTPSKDLSGIYQANYIPYPADQHIRGGHSEGSAMGYYRKGDYQNAIIAFKNMSADDPSNSRIYLFLGNCYLNTGDALEAKRNFELGSQSGNSIIRQHCEWYMAMTYLYMEDVAAAKTQLMLMGNSTHLYKKKSLKILNQLN